MLYRVTISYSFEVEAENKIEASDKASEEYRELWPFQFDEFNEDIEIITE